jgi:hypothetical protein
MARGVDQDAFYWVFWVLGPPHLDVAKSYRLEKGSRNEQKPKPTVFVMVPHLVLKMK